MNQYARIAGWVSLITALGFLLFPRIEGLWNEASAFQIWGWGLLLLSLGIFVFTAPPPHEQDNQGGQQGRVFAYPHGPTRGVLVLIISITVSMVLMTLALLRGWAPNGHQGLVPPMVMMASAGIGSSLATLLAFLKHASEKKDFSPAYVPWYFMRPTNGILLGLIFYWLVVGGLLSVLPASGEKSLDTSKIDRNALAGIGATVGFFSREAIERLREVFKVLFATSRRVPDSVKDRILQEERSDTKRQRDEYFKELDALLNNSSAKQILLDVWNKARGFPRPTMNRDDLLLELKTYMNDAEKNAIDSALK